MIVFCLSCDCFTGSLRVAHLGGRGWKSAGPTEGIPSCHYSSVSPLVSTGNLLREGEFFAFLDDVSHLQTERCWRFSCGKTQTLEPQWDHTQRMRGVALNPEAVVWRGDHRLPVVQQGWDLQWGMTNSSRRS